MVGLEMHAADERVLLSGAAQPGMPRHCKSPYCDKPKVPNKVDEIMHRNLWRIAPGGLEPTTGRLEGPALSVELRGNSL